MDTIGRAAFAEAVVALDPPAFRSFVAAVYRHRPGYVVVDAAGAPVDAAAADDAGEHDGRRVYPSHPDGDRPDDLAAVADVAVTTTDPSDDADAAVEWVGPDDLFDLVRYGLPADAGDAVCERHLGAVPRQTDALTFDAAGGVPGASTPEGDAPGRSDDGATGLTGDPALGGTSLGEKATDAGTGASATAPGASGAPPADDEPDGEAIDGTADGEAIDGTGGRRTWVLAAGVLAAVLLVAGVLGAPALLGTGDRPTAGAVTETPTTTRTPTGTETPSPTTATATSTPAPTPEGIAGRYAALRPTCERPPQVVVAIQLGALRTDNGTDRGIRTTYEFASPGNREWTRTFENFVRIVRSDDYDELLTHEQVTYAPVEVSNRTATQRVTVFDADGDAARYRFDLTKVAAGEYAGCWMTDGVGRVDEPAVGNATATVAGETE